MMYEWSATQKNLLFISGHTHKPVFASLDHIDRLTKQLQKAVAAQ
jgi:predicted phosphodiesterase